jgi:hypothetical protein
MAYNKRDMGHDEQALLRTRAVNDAVATVQLEGFEPSSDLLADLQQWTADELSLNEVGERLFARFAEEDRAKIDPTLQPVSARS